MKKNNQESEKLLKQFFQAKKMKESPSIPDFADTFQAAQKRARSKKHLKAALIAAAISLLMIISFAVQDDLHPMNMNNIVIAKGSMNLYEMLMKEGEIVTNEIHFEYDRAEIKATSFPILNSLVEMLKKHKKINLHIEGHTDITGSTLYNQQLSFARANEVRRALIKRGISPTRLTAEGLGESQPAYDNETEKGRVLNRRVAFVLVK